MKTIWISAFVGALVALLFGVFASVCDGFMQRANKMKWQHKSLPSF